MLSGVAIQHACTHLGEALFKCHICNQGFAKSQFMIRHLKRIHNVTNVSSNAIDIPSIYEHEITVIIKRCFGPERKLSVAAEPSTKTLAPDSIR